MTDCKVTFGQVGEFIRHVLVSWAAPNVAAPLGMWEERAPQTAVSASELNGVSEIIQSSHLMKLGMEYRDTLIHSR